MNSMDSLYIVMPAYNEEEAIRDVVREWYSCLACASDDSRLLVDISGSTDQTETILRTMQHDYPKLRILTGGRKEHGPKLIRLYRTAALAGADYVFQTDSDGQTNPFEFAPFWDARKDHPVQLGWRLVRGDGFARKIIEDVLCFILLLIFQVRIPDSNAPFRLMRTDLLKRYLKYLPSDYPIPNVMLSVWFSAYREPLAFREITFRPRQGGKNSLNLGRIIRIGISSISGFLHFRRKL